MEKASLKISGMSCKSCSARIEKYLLNAEGVVKATVSFKTGKAYLEYEPEKTNLHLINKRIRVMGFGILPENNHESPGKPVAEDRQGKFKSLKPVFCFITICIALFIYSNHLSLSGILTVLNNLLLLKYLPELDNKADTGLVFLFGLLASFHCIGMCGGIAISQCMGKCETDRENRTKFKWVRPSLYYNIGRIAAYTALGGIAGGMGSVISLPGKLKGIVPVAGGIILVVMALNVAGLLPALCRLYIRTPFAYIGKLFGNMANKPFYAGLLNGFMPCGPMQIAQFYALSTRSVWTGSLSMFVFAAGTVPVMFGIGAASSLINKKNYVKFYRFSAVVILVLGLSMIGRGLTLSGVSFPGGSGKNNSYKARLSAGTLKMSHEGIYGRIRQSAEKSLPKTQTVIVKIKSGYYPSIVVKRGIPVSWIITAEESELNECNDTLVIPLLNLEKKLHPGENLIEFLPAETGDMVYTCWMGMIKGKITVVN